ncbi:hypothetical protein MANES_04G036766v8 [Manihot esculenta]|uniref:Uncharacterized protein n=1 Tax=Manihot esculenta TaxID=3983 RepID=A0ACB7HTV0_MANES|nr:hypothetical protein MANES_04G036766v8 [Manihot esculenta]
MTSICPPDKDAWPELVGVDGDFVVATIEKENKDVNAILVMLDDFVIMNFNCNRVWVIVDKNNIVFFSVIR